MAMIYLVSLLTSLGCMVLLDHRFGLVFWRNPRAGVVVLAVGLGVFLAWDLAAISAQHYASGTSEVITGLMLAPELPVEEIVFITFLCYLTLVLRGLLVLAVDGCAPRGGGQARRDLRARHARRGQTAGERP